MTSPDAVIQHQLVQPESEATPIDFNAPTVQRGKNSAINLLIALGAFTLPANHPLRGYVKPERGEYFPHQGEREMERRQRQLAKSQIELGDYKYGTKFESKLTD